MKPNLAIVVYCYGINQGGVDNWNFALEQYEMSNVASVKNEILQSLGCASNATLLTEYVTQRAIGRSLSIMTIMTMGFDILTFFLTAIWICYGHLKKMVESSVTKMLSLLWHLFPEIELEKILHGTFLKIIGRIIYSQRKCVDFEFCGLTM